MKITKRFSSKFIGAGIGGAVTYHLNHISEAVAVSLKTSTSAERLRGRASRRHGSTDRDGHRTSDVRKSFFNGFIVSSGTFLSFDIILFHGVSQLHRIISGPEADILEPILVAFGIAMTAAGITWQRRQSN